MGLAVGSMITAVPMYNSEMSPAEVRPTMVGTFQLSVTFGIMLLAWRLPLALQAIPSILLALSTFFIPYSPRWLLKHGRDQEAFQVLSYVRNLPIEDEVVRLEFLEIRADSVFEHETAAEKYPNAVGRAFAPQFADLFKPRAMFRRTAITCLMMWFRQMSGIDAIVVYAPTQSLGLGDTSISLLASGVVGISTFVAKFPGIIYIDELSRRPLLSLGGFGISASLLTMGVLTATHAHKWAARQASAAAWTYVLCFGAIWGPCSWVVIAEIMPMSARAVSTALGASTNWMTNLCVSHFVPPILERIGWGTYIFLLGFMLMDVALEAIDRVSKSSDATHDAERMCVILERLQAEYAEGKGDKGESV
ncbi:hypothetical protein CspeluHIS016_0207350 [Cutaneotrichosporon spelunceum]|uniref:Major facilitator superfamily (MFS) profile domain-containing protein n=1 Tax=Cutaneotrichosporon spelunceum TaxID=1672016 RepID=A0AAD3TRX3_9TREE|nr:hypothetical protein CspeluHIS016_0207350 [Cutaneotrichosporon spelunceum]